MPKDWTIAEFKLLEVENSPVPTLEVAEIAFVHSRHSLEECRELFRAVVHFHLALELQQHPLDENRKRQRRLLIYHDRRAAWQWSMRLLQVARLYKNQLQRPEHRAQLSLQGHAVRFAY